MVDVRHNAVQDFILLRSEGHSSESHIENHVSSRVLHNSFEVSIIQVEVVSDDVDDVAVFLGALADELLVDPLVTN